MAGIFQNVKPATHSFGRSVKPENMDPDIPPTLVTFCDGNPDSYGTVAYTMWSLLDGSRVTMLMMSKANLGPLLMKGETVIKELSGATISIRLKEFIFCFFLSILGSIFGFNIGFNIRFNIWIQYWVSILGSIFGFNIWFVISFNIMFQYTVEY